MTSRVTISISALTIVCFQAFAAPNFIAESVAAVGSAYSAVVLRSRIASDIRLPLAQQPCFIEGSKVLTDFNNSSARMWGRLAPGITCKTAE